MKSSLAIFPWDGRVVRMTEHELPTRNDLLWPSFKALEARGSSASIEELHEQVATDLSLPDEVLNVLHKDGPRSEVEYRAAWARTHLKMINAVDNTSRGIWTITETGRRMRTEGEVRELVRRERARQYKKNRTPDEQDWKETLLKIIRSIKPDVIGPHNYNQVK